MTLGQPASYYNRNSWTRRTTGPQTPSATNPAPLAAKPSSSGIRDISTPVNPSMNGTGVDPSSTWTGTTARAEVERQAGRPLTPAELAQAGNLAGYNDPSGNTALSGAQVNEVLREGARLTNGTYTDFQGPRNPGPMEPGQTGPTWQVPDAPEYTGVDYQPAARYSGSAYEQYAPFRAPTQAEAENDAGYQFALNQGNRAIENSAASRGMLRGSNTLQQVADYNRGAAGDQYDRVYGRMADTYDRNLGEHRYASGQARDDARYMSEADRDEARFGYGARNEQEQLRYAPRLMTWQARNQANQRQSELGWDRDWQRETYNRDDAYRRYTYGRDDDYRRWLEDNVNRRFLIGQGNQ